MGRCKTYRLLNYFFPKSKMPFTNSPREGTILAGVKKYFLCLMPFRKRFRRNRAAVGPRASPAKRVAWGEEAQRKERAFGSLPEARDLQLAPTRGLGISPTSQASKMTVFRFQESGHFLHLADICPACRLRQSGNCTTNALLAGIWTRRGLSKCPDRCPACRDLIRTRNSATVYTDAQLAGNGKQHLDIQMPSLLVTVNGRVSGQMHCLPGLASLWYVSLAKTNPLRD